ncbi:MAG: MotA/TolQ/ExbB proton channel family protein [Planctomycetia bacterium]|nr:MotA/TolQ/ExbB proton channel family protein [Planctomycetia bacterium]
MLSNWRTNQRTSFWGASVCLAVVVFAVICLAISSSAFAFQDANAKDAAADDKAIPVEMPGEPVAQPTAIAPATPAEPAGGDQPTQKNFLEWLIAASGPFGACIFVESFIMVALIIMCLLQIRRQNFLPPEFIAGYEAKLGAQDYQGAFNLAKSDDSLLARLLAVGMSKFQRGPDAVMKAMSELGEDENMLLEHRLNYLALIATTAPMFGLLGTVQGMVQAFEEIANSNTTPKPSELAEGIQLALVTTLEGLIVAIPAMIAYSLLRNRVIRLMFDTGLVSEDLINRLPARTTSATPTSPPIPAS